MQNPSKDFCLALVSESGRNWPRDIDNHVLCQCASYVAETPFADQIDASVVEICELPPPKKHHEN